MLKKRLDYGFSGYQVPFVPRAARSTRRRGPIKEKGADNQLCAFDLLATVAGKLLEGESSLNESREGNQQSNVRVSNVDMKEKDEGNVLLRAKQFNKGCSEISSLGLPIQDEDCNANSALASMITSSHCLENDETNKNGFCSQSEERELCVNGQINSCVPNLSGFVVEKGGILSEKRHDMNLSEDPEVLSGKARATASSDCSVKLSLGVDHCGSLSPCRGNNVNIVTRDDDENSSECTQPSSIKAARLPARIGNRRIRKLLASQHWRVGSKVKDGDLSDNELRYLYRRRRTGYKRQRSQRIYPFKKRKFYRYSTLSTSSDVDTVCNGVYDSPNMAVDRTLSSFSNVKHGVNGSSSYIAGKSTAFQHRESHVKLRIKSFRVPELYIEMPETATIGSLKRKVMDAVTSLLGGGLSVGVLYQGKKMRDDNRTLVQSGICHDEKVDSLCFSLEPNSCHVGTPVCSEDNSVTLSMDVPQPISSCPSTAVHIQGPPDDHATRNVGNLVESDHDSTPSPTEITTDRGGVDSLALVAIPDGTPQALAVAPTLEKSKRSEMAQRRIRRPFSVSEVEALVQAVEKLGTGRWRDVKLRAFENVKHRTYVDLKDKWKTLVHTARIFPQQRRGEPVPQELLDRVLCAHSYWSQQQAKQHLKQPSDPCLLSNTQEANNVDL